jgi:sugar fermentation stimulation protein A
MIQVCDNEPTWVGVNTALPNRVIKLGLENPLSELGAMSKSGLKYPTAKRRKAE